MQAIVELVRGGVGVGVSPLVAGWSPGAGVRALPTDHLFPPDALVLVRRRGRPRPQALLLEELLLQAPGSEPEASARGGPR